jgi:hypothetical protein
MVGLAQNLSEWISLGRVCLLLDNVERKHCWAKFSRFEDYTLYDLTNSHYKLPCVLNITDGYYHPGTGWQMLYAVDPTITRANSNNFVRHPLAAEPPTYPDRHTYLLDCLRHEKKTEYKKVVTELSAFKDSKIIKPLIEILVDTELQDETRECASQILVALKELSLRPLIDAHNTDDINVRTWVADALGEIRDKVALPALILDAHHKHEGVRLWGVRAISRIGTSLGFKVLDDVIRKDQSWEVRIEAVEALGRLGNEQAIEVLIYALTDEDEDVRNSAINSLLNFGTLALKPLIDALIKAKSE